MNKPGGFDPRELALAIRKASAPAEVGVAEEPEEAFDYSQFDELDDLDPLPLEDLSPPKQSVDIGAILKRTRGPMFKKQQEE